MMVVSKRLRQSALEKNAECGACGDGSAVDNGAQSDHVVYYPSFALLY